MAYYDDELIDEIVNAIDIVDFIGEYVDLTRKNRYFFGECPFHNEDTASFCITPSKNMYHCFGCGVTGNVITFYQKYNNVSYQEALNYCASYAGLSTERREIASSVKFFRRNKKENERINQKPKEHKKINPGRLQKFQHGNIQLWRNEGIPQEIMDKYGVAFDKKSQRIIYPVYDIDGNLINIKGRTVIENYKDTNPPTPKYISYEEIGDLDYFQGLNFKADIVREKGEIIIFESFKSVMKADSYGYENSVSMENHTLNKFQMKLLIGLQCDVVFALDKDIKLSEITDNKYVQTLKRFTNIYVVIDKKNMLGEKDSPVDCGKEIWECLYKNKIKL